MTQTLDEIGQTFRTKREEMHLSLKEVENATSIRQMYLQAIEEGKSSQFLSPVYAMGFIKQYANFLGFDGEKIIRDNPTLFKASLNKQEFSYGIGTLEKRGTPHSGAKKNANAFWIGVSIAILLGAYLFGKVVGVF